MIEIAPAAEWPHMAALLLSRPGYPELASATQVRDFLSYVHMSGAAAECLVIRSPRGLAAMVFTLRLPGRVALLLLPSPGQHGIEFDAQQALLRDTLKRLSQSARGTPPATPLPPAAPQSPAAFHSPHCAQPLYYAQILIDPNASAVRTLSVRCGFTFLTQLRYFDREIGMCIAAPPAAGHTVQWADARSLSDEQITHALEATYEASLDCPEMSALRPTEAALVAHRGGSGSFDPRLWQFAFLDGRPAGCLLLGRTTHSTVLEITYMGVAAGSRGRGLGLILMERGRQIAQQAGGQRLTLAVDSRNEPALRLYARCGFVEVGRRDAYLYVWSQGARSAG